MNYSEKWNQIHRDYFKGKIIYDNWLDNYKEVINNAKGLILDLGCGEGNNSLYLTEKDKNILACDFSSYALELVHKYLPNVLTKQFDMTKPFPIEDNSIDLVIADLSLHYFSEEETFKILDEIKRILVNNGYLLFRVNSTKDINHGAMQGVKIEKNYYEVDNMKKRFFDEEDIRYFFKEWYIINVTEDEMTRYTKPKVLLRGMVKRI